MKQDHYVFNIAKLDGETFDGKPRFVHYCAIEKPKHDFSNSAELLSFVAQLRKAFAVLGEFKISVTLWTFRGETIDV